MKVYICKNEIEYKVDNGAHYFDAKSLCRLVWKYHSYYIKKWQESENISFYGTSSNPMCTRDQFKEFYNDNLPAEKGKSQYYDEFMCTGLLILDELINPPIIPEMIEKEKYDLLVVDLNESIDEIGNLNIKVNELSNKIEELNKKDKPNTPLRNSLLHPELPLWAQVITAIVLTFFTWTVFSHYFKFGIFSEYMIFHYGITLFAATAFEFSLLIFTVRKQFKWLHIMLLFQFIILGIHSGLLKGQFESMEDFAIKLVLTSLLPITNKAFSATNI